MKNRLLAMPLRTSTTRALGAFGNVCAIESYMDEIATAQGVDPLEFRLRHLLDTRGREVLTRVAAMADWAGTAPPDGRGRGMAFARDKNTGAYCAVVAEIEVDENPRSCALWIAVDVGEAINTDGVVPSVSPAKSRNRVARRRHHRPVIRIGVECENVEDGADMKKPPPGWCARHVGEGSAGRRGALPLSSKRSITPGLRAPQSGIRHGHSGVDATK